jgi:hypothetical protein
MKRSYLIQPKHDTDAKPLFVTAKCPKEALEKHGVRMTSNKYHTTFKVTRLTEGNTVEWCQLFQTKEYSVSFSYKVSEVFPHG